MNLLNRYILSQVFDIIIKFKKNMTRKNQRFKLCNKVYLMKDIKDKVIEIMIRLKIRSNKIEIEK